MENDASSVSKHLRTFWKAWCSIFQNVPGQAQASPFPPVFIRSYAPSYLSTTRVYKPRTKSTNIEVNKYFYLYSD